MQRSVSSPDPTSKRPNLLELQASSSNEGLASPTARNLSQRILPLRCVVQRYAWGRFGPESLVGRLAAANDDDFVLEPQSPYAELWMGTHPSGPSIVQLGAPFHITTPLKDWLKINRSASLPPSSAGSLSAQRRADLAAVANATGLPFLFKVLSVRTALSIQAHPNKSLAEQLHYHKPAQYKDDNHKPEMTIAVTRFEALCSFQKVSKVLANCRDTPELVAVVGEPAMAKLAAAAEQAAPFTPPKHNTGARRPDDGRAKLTAEELAGRRAAIVKPAMRTLFSALMSAEPAHVATQLEALMRRIAATSPRLLSPVDELAARLHAQYPSDVGVFCVYLLNFTILQPGEALFLAANEPHAYIFGDCIECMATSDNVVRAGLTPKFKDVDVLCEMLTYNDGAPFLVRSSAVADGVERYLTPVPEFLVDKVELAAAQAALLPSSPFASILLVVDGEGTLDEYGPGSDAGTQQHSLSAGSVFVMYAWTKVRAASQSRLLAFRATSRYILEEADR